MSSDTRASISGDSAASMPGAAHCGSAFLGQHHEHHERRTWWVVWLTAAMMIGEIVGGTIYGSMALVADGWHMATHAAALSIAALAYRYARQHRNNPRFAFGTGKVGELAGFASAITLGLVALLIAWESMQRLLNPRTIAFDQATAIAVLGLVVNLVSAKLLAHDHSHEHAEEESGHDHADDHDHDHEVSRHPGEGRGPSSEAMDPGLRRYDDHRHDREEGEGDRYDAGHHDHDHHHDTNIRAAYLHVLADALTSVLAIAGLLAGRFLGWMWLDPAIGIVGALVIAHWSINLMRTASASLLDASANQRLSKRIADRLTSGVDAITDLHLWRVGPGHYALIVSLTSQRPQSPDVYKSKLADLQGLSHVTIEVNASKT